MNNKELEAQLVLGSLPYKDRLVLSANPNTSTGILSILSKDEDPRVVINVVSNPNTPIKIKDRLLKDEVVSLMLLAYNVRVIRPGVPSHNIYIGDIVFRINAECKECGGTCNSCDACRVPSLAVMAAAMSGMSREEIETQLKSGELLRGYLAEEF